MAEGTITYDTKGRVWSYNGINEDSILGTIRCTGDITFNILGITMQMGTGDRHPTDKNFEWFTNGVDGRSWGNPFPLKLWAVVNNERIYTDEQIIDTKVYPTWNPDNPGKTIPGPPYGLYTFMFNTPLLLVPNGSIPIYCHTPLNNSYDGTGALLCVPYGSFAQEYKDTVIKEEPQPEVYYVQYDANGGSGPPAKQTTNVGTSTTVGNKPTGVPTFRVTFDISGGIVVNPPYKDYPRSFNNWNTVNNGSGTAYSPGDAFPSQTKDSTTTLYAQWGNATITGLPTPSESDEEFKYWGYSDKSKVNEGDPLPGNITVYPCYSVKVTFNGNGGIIYDPSAESQDGVNPSNTKVYEVDPDTYFRIPQLYVTKPLPSTSSDDGSMGSGQEQISSDFVGWNTSASAKDAAYQTGNVYHVTGSVTFYAIFKIRKFTVKFTDGYSVPEKVLKTEQVEYGKDATPPPDPVRKGYKFLGWSVGYLDVKEDKTIKAMWSKTPIWILKAGEGWVRYEPEEV